MGQFEICAEVGNKYWGYFFPVDAADFRVKIGNVWMNATDVDGANAIPLESEGGKKLLSGFCSKNGTGLSVT